MGLRANRWAGGGNEAGGMPGSRPWRASSRTRSAVFRMCQRIPQRVVDVARLSAARGWGFLLSWPASRAMWVQFGTMRALVQRPTASESSGEADRPASLLYA